MTHYEHMIRKARRRGLLSHVLDRAAFGLLVGSGAGVLLLLADRLIGLGLPAAAHAVLPLAGLAAGVAGAVMNHPGLVAYARRLDRALGLKDRLATAQVLSSTGAAGAGGDRRWMRDDGFAALVQRDAERASAGIDVRSISPIRIRATWAGAIAAALILWLGVMYLPQQAWGRTPPAPGAYPAAAISEEEHEQRERLRESLDETIDDLRRQAGEDDPAAQAHVDALERLAEQLASDPELSPERAREQTAAHLDELAEQLAEQARRDALAAERLAERFSRLERAEAPMSAREFQDALQRGDFGAAAQRLEDLLERDDLTAQERRELSQHLRDVAEHIDHPDPAQQRFDEERLAQIEQLMRDHGLDEQALRGLLEGDEELDREIEQHLRDQDFDEAMIERMMRELQRLREQREAQAQAQRDADEISRALEEAAEALDEPDEPEEPDPPREPDEPEAPEAPHEPGEAPDPEAPGEPAERPDPDAEPSPDAEREEVVEEERPRRDPEAPGEPRQTPDPDAEREAEAPDPDAPPDEGAPDAPPAPDPDAEEDPDEPGRPAPGEEQPTEEVEEPQPGVEEQPDARPSPSDALRRLEERRRAVEERDAGSQRMRERARRLAEEMTDPGEVGQEQIMPRPEGEAGAGGAGLDGPRGRPGDPPPREPMDVKDIDVRDEEVPPGEILAEWFSDEEGIEPVEGVRRGEARERIRRAREIAERAVNEQAVPARYHDLIRRYFGRLDEREPGAGD